MATELMAPQKLLEDQTIVDQNWRGYCRARDNGHLTYVREAKMYDRYYYGEQWDAETLAKLNAARRPAQTINLCLSTVNAVMGEYLATRQQIEILPVDADASENTATALSKVIHNILYDSRSKYVEKQVVSDGLIQDRGYFDIRLNFEENVFGEVRETALDPLDVLLDPGGREYDPRSWSEVYVTRWMTPDQIEEEYPGKGKALRFCDAANSYGYDAIEFDPDTFSQKSSYFTHGPDGYTFQDDWQQVRRIRVIERQYFKMDMRRFFLDVASGDTSPVPDAWTDERVQQVIDYTAQQGIRLTVYKRPTRRVRWTVTADKHKLHDDWSPYDQFTVVPFFPYFRRGRPFGVVRNLISPQDTLNKVTSQELHVVNTTANSGWVVQVGSLANMTVDQLEQVGAKTGLVVEYNRGFEPPQKIQPNQVPNGLDRISSKAMMYFREISGVSEAMLGQPGKEISGAALQAKKSNGLVQLDVVFDNLALTRQIRGEIMLNLVRSFYTDTRLVKILGTGDEGERVTEDIALNQPDPATNEILNDVTLGEYRIVITSDIQHDNERDSDVQQLLEMRNAGVLVPDWAVIEASSIRNRREIADWVRRTQGAAEPTEEEVALAQAMQELEIRRAMAEVSELESKAQMNLATAQKMIAEAEALPAEAQSKMMELGAQLRADIQTQVLELQKNREDLATRLALMREKTKAENYQANLQALTKRLEAQSKERIASMRGVSRVAASKK